MQTTTTPRFLTALLFGTGFVASLMSMGAGVKHPYGPAAALAGALLLTLGGMRLAQEKGHSRWLGLLGLLGWLGAAILLLLPRNSQAEPESPASQRVKRAALLLTMGIAAVLFRDSLHGRDHRWLPEVFVSQIFLGPPLFFVAGVAFLRELRQGQAVNPWLAQVASGLLWVARGMGLALLVAPFLAMWSVSANRPPGVRPGNEGESLGISIIFMFCFPAGLALIVATCWPRRKSPAIVAKPDDGGQE